VSRWALAVIACVTGCGRSGIDPFDVSIRDSEPSRSGSGGTVVTGGAGAGAGAGSSGSGTGGQGGFSGAPGGASPIAGAGSGGALTGGAGSGGFGGHAGDTSCPDFEPGADRLSPWSFQFGDEEFQQGTNVVAAPDGSSYVAGLFKGALDLGSGLWQADTGGDAFVAGLEPGGRIRFALRFQGGASVRAMALTSQGVLVVVGTFSGAVDFGGTTLVAEGLEKAFLLELDSCGHVLRALAYGEDVASIDAVTTIGDSYAIGGWFVGRIDVGAGPWENSGTEPEAFVARMDRESSPVWARHLSGVRRVVLTADDDKNVYIAGRVEEVLDLGDAGSLSGPRRAFVAKLDTKGSPLWGVLDQGERSGNDGSSSSDAITIDSVGHVIVQVGSIYTSLDFGDGAKADYVCCGGDELALSIHPDGVPLWLNLIDTYTAVRIAKTSTGFVAVTNTGGAQGLEVRSYDVNGINVGTQGFGFASYVSVYDVAVDELDSMLVTGNFRGQIDLGSGPLEPTQGFDWDGFVTRLPENALK
jgi:hypothetical protein